MARKIKVAVTTASQLLEVYDYDSTTGEINNQYIGAYGGLGLEKTNGLQDLTNASHSIALTFPNGGNTGLFTISELESFTVDGSAVACATLAAFVTNTAQYLLPPAITSTISGEDDGGNSRTASMTPEGHLEVAIHSPRLPFGAVHTENLSPIFQADGVYGLNPQLVRTTTSGTGGATTENSSFKVSTGAGLGAFGTIQSRKRLRYRAGQGIVGRFAGLFSTPVADSIVVAGFGHAEDGVFFGYNGTSFGILWSRRGVRATYTLTVTGAVAVGGSVIITLNGTAYTIATPTTGNIQRTVYEISQGTFAGWEATAVGATVVFVKNSVGATAGAFSFDANGTGATAAIAQTKAGAAASETWYPQTQWNGDRLDGSGNPTTNPSGVTLNPQFGNVYQVGIQYLGYGAVTFAVEITPTGNNPEFVVVHTIRNPNTQSDTTFGNPSYPFTMAAYSAGSTTDVYCKVGSFAGFVEGHKVLHGPRMTYDNTLAGTAGAVNYQAIFTVKNSLYYQGRTNQAVINLLNITGAFKHNQPGTFYLIKNGTLGGNPNFQSRSSSSCSLWDTAATTVSFSDGNQVIVSIPLGETSSFDHHFGNGEYNAEEVTLQPGESITLACKTVSGTATYAMGSMNTREDQ